MTQPTTTLQRTARMIATYTGSPLHTFALTGIATLEALKEAEQELRDTNADESPLHHDETSAIIDHLRKELPR